MFENIKSLFSKSSLSIRIISFLILSIAVIYTSSDMYDYQTQQYENRVYTKVNDDILNITKLLIKQKKDATLLSAITMAQNPSLIDIIFGKRHIKVDLNKLALDLKKHTDFSNIQFTIIDESGIVVKRSWTDVSGDDLHEDSNIADVLKNKQPKSILTANKFGMSINSLVPIVYDGDLVGILNVVTHFDSIVKKLNEYGFNAVVILDKKRSDNIDIRESFSKRFIRDNYVVNNNADDLAVKIVNSRGINHYNDFYDNYHIHKEINNFETIFKLENEQNRYIGFIVLFKSLDDIQMDNLQMDQQIHLALTIFIIFVIALIAYYRNSYKYIAKIKADNEKLLVFNSQLNDKNDELDFNEKKIANIFHIQPNFMFISDGQVIESANARFLWFFSTYYDGGLEEFSEHHKCISDYFIKCDDDSIDSSDYISGDTIQGVPWKDYILKNFKKQYKVCMKNGYGGLHHFIIKMTEMEYAKLVKRYIVVSFIDITHEINLAKESKNKQALLLEKTKIDEMNEMVGEIATKLDRPVEEILILANIDKYEDKNKKININIDKNNTNEIRHFIKEQSDETQTNLVEIVNILLDTINQSYSEHQITIIKSFTEELLAKTMVSEQLSQVVMNLMTNAKYELTNRQNENRWIKVTIIKDRNQAVISIEDNAGGIKEDIMNDIFQQYFSTKPENIASGLGLFVCKNIVEKKLHGTIEVGNTVDGAMFTIKIPLDTK